MGRLNVVSPAGWTDCLTCAGGRALARKAAIWMRAKGETVAIFSGEELLAVAYLVPDDAGRWEFCLSIRITARPHMRTLCRLAHSTLTGLVEDGGVVVCHVAPGNIAGQRMAFLCGFRASDNEWTFGGEDHGADREGLIRRRDGQWRGESGEGKQANPDGGERSPAVGG